MWTAIGEAALSAFWGQIFGKLTSDLDCLRLVPNDQVCKELEGWKRKLLSIKVWLDDAERKQMKDPLVKEWLADVQDLFYDADDILDEFATEALRCKLQQVNPAHTSKVQKLALGMFASFNPSSFLFNRDVMSKLEGITTRLNDLEKQRSDLGLKNIDDIGAARPTKRLQPTSLVDETHVYGREKEKANIIEMLSKGDENGVSVIPIVGMGGIGKTTLAQLVYNDPSIQSSFDQKAWVCVSEEFDAIAITKTILRYITAENYTDVTDLSLLQEQLKKKLSGKKLLLVLDDVWHEIYKDLSILLSPFGAETKILLTTRSHKVSSLVGTLQTYELEELSEEGCLSVFTHHALRAPDFSGYPELEKFGENIVKKCKGLPLAANAVGGLLRTCMDSEVWKEVSESEMWDLAEEQCGEIPAALRLSYYHLPSHLKRCFAYCSIFPKGYQFCEEETILLWRAEGFLQQENTRTPIKGKGREYFRDLVTRSFFQISSRDESRFLMHDLVNDLAQSVAGKICSKLEGDKRGRFSPSTRHSSYLESEIDGMKKFEVFDEAKNLRTFLPLDLLGRTSKRPIGHWFLSNVVLNDLLPKLKCLRVLSLRGYNITELPHFFKNFKHLRYVDFSYTCIKYLPNSICSLHNLQTLKLEGCSKLERLPEIENLVNLDYLDISGASSLKRMPLGIGELTNLQKLPFFVLGAGDGDHVRKLKNLAKIRGEFCLSGLENIVNAQDAREAKLSDKLEVDSLKLKWSTNSDTIERNEEVEEQVLNFLCPHKKLSGLMVMGYGGATFSTWIVDSSLDHLLFLELSNCKNCKSLPPIGKLPKLKHLSIRGMHQVTVVGVEFFGESHLNAFSSLESLHFFNMPNWKEWYLPCDIDDQVLIFPSLVELSIRDCPQLLGRLPNRLQSLQKLEIFWCEHLVISISSLWSLQKLVIHNCKQLVISVSSLPLLRELEINGCGELRYSNADNFTALKSVMLMSISKFVIPPARMAPGLTKLEYSFCSMGNISGMECSPGGLPRDLNALKFLTEMRITGCPSLVSFAAINLPAALKRLEIICCHNLQYLVDDENTSSGYITNQLQVLSIENCSKLNFLFSNPMMFPMMLKKLEIWMCPEFESIAPEFQETICLESISIWECPKIKSLPRGLHKLSHLRKIGIQFCSNLVSLEEGDLRLASNVKLLAIQNCQNFGALPKSINNFTSLRQLTVWNCSADVSFPEEGGFPANLTELSISKSPKLYRSLVQWGLHRLAALDFLRIGGEGCSDVVSFPEESIGMMLPPSLTRMEITKFENLEYMFSLGFQPLTSLRILSIRYCDKLMALPEKDNLLWLGHLYIENCPLLKMELEKGKGREWSKIDHIPHVRIDRRSIIPA